MNTYTYLIYSKHDGGVFDRIVQGDTPDDGFFKSVDNYCQLNEVTDFSYADFELVACIRGEAWFETTSGKINLFPGA